MQDPCISAGMQQELLSSSAYGHERTWQHTVSSQPPQENRILVGDTVDHELAVLVYIGERFGNLFRHFPVESGNAVSVRVESWAPEFCVNAFLEALGNKMLQPLRLAMDFPKRGFKNLIEKRFEQPMVANDLQRASHACGREAHSTVRFVLDELG